MGWRIGIAAFLVVIAVAALVQSTVTKTQIYKVSEINSAEHLGGTVAVEGDITYAEDNIFILDDGTGKIEISTCPTWYKKVNVYVGDKIVVTGQVMKNPSLETKTDLVISAYKIFRDDEVIEIRGRPGKPPWITHREGESPSP